MIGKELLALSRQIANLPDPGTHQVNLRAVSTAYYALFHFIIQEATLVWSHDETRPVLARVFEHGRMKALCDKTRGSIKDLTPFGQRTPDEHLRAFAKTFIQAQEAREDADYDTTSQWALANVEDHIELTGEEIRSWETIRDEPAARQFLVQLFGPRQSRR